MPRSAVVAKAARDTHGMTVVGFLDGFTGLVENRFMPISDEIATGLLTLGGTILGTSRHKPHKMPLPDGSTRDMTGAALETYRQAATRLVWSASAAAARPRMRYAYRRRG